MGYKVKRKAYRLRFEDPDMDGLVVLVRGMNTGKFIEFQNAKAKQEDAGPDEMSPTEEMCRMFIDALIEWNLEDDDGNPLPPTMESLESLDLDFSMAMVNAWPDAVKGVSDPLPQTSTGGSTSVEASIPMDVPSASLAS